MKNPAGAMWHSAFFTSDPLEKYNVCATRDVKSVVTSWSESKNLLRHQV